MNILALHTQHNAGCAYMEDGVIRCVVNEEKFTNIKNDASFPLNSIQYILETYDINHFDAVIIAAEKSTINESHAQTTTFQDKGASWQDHLVIGLHKMGLAPLYNVVQRLKFLITSKRHQEFVKDYVLGLNLFTCDEFLFFDHHDCHAYAAFGSLKRENQAPCVVLTADGQGDLSCSKVYIGSEDGLKLIASSYWTHSLGELYGKMTKLLGMKQLEHEYKVMGLAPYAEDKDYYKPTRQALFEGLIEIKDDLTFSSKLPMHLIDIELKKKTPYHRFDNIAAALQTYTEDTVITWVQKTIAKTGLSTFFTGGGLFMNVKVNKRLQEMPEVEEVNFMPSCGDESLPIGACYKYHFDQTGSFGKPLDNIYLGPSFSNDDIGAFIKQHDLEKRYCVSYEEDMETKIAELLYAGDVVARFKGRTEWGARSLGNRAILARPDKMESFFRVNDQVKMRDFWMPFAPSMLRAHYQDYLVASKDQIAPYMITSFESTEKGRSDFRAAMHNRDKTLRAQIVDQAVNPSYHDLLVKFYSLSGIAGVMNTSFNLHGYPLVSSPDQALFTFENCDLEHMALENYLLSKRK